VLKQIDKRIGSILAAYHSAIVNKGRGGGGVRSVKNVSGKCLGGNVRLPLDEAVSRETEEG